MHFAWSWSAALGANVDRYSFIAVDLHHLLLAGLSRRSASNHAPTKQRHSHLSLCRGRCVVRGSPPKRRRPTSSEVHGERLTMRRGKPA